jgi:hypothetical protein
MFFLFCKLSAAEHPRRTIFHPEFDNNELSAYIVMRSARNITVLHGLRRRHAIRTRIAMLVVMH